MKILLVLIYFISITTGYTQPVKVRELKLNPNTSILKATYSTIVYPIIITSKKVINKLINAKISNEILGSENDLAVNSESFKELLNDGLTDMSYEVTFNANDLLSIHISMQKNIGNHIVITQSYFNFDIKTGKSLVMADLLNENMIDSFKQKVLADKIAFLAKYKTSEVKHILNKNSIDTAIYDNIIGQLDSNCMNDLDMENFILSFGYIEIVDPCHFSTALRWLEPDYKLKYSGDNIYIFLKNEFRIRIMRILMKKFFTMTIKSRLQESYVDVSPSVLPIGFFG